MRPLLLLLCGMSTALAAPSADIVVTSTRIPAPLSAVGGAATVLELDEFDAAGLSIADVLRAQTGIQLHRAGGPGQLAQLRLRGAEANHALVLLDGVELTSPVSGAVDFSGLGAHGIARIEILRGAQSALWGSRAAAGVIHLISKDAAAAPDLLQLHAGGDRERAVRLQLATGGARAGLALHGQTYRTDGDNASLAGAERDGYRHREAQLRARYRSGARTEIRALLRHARGDAEYDGFAGGRPVDADHRSRRDRTAAGLSLHTRLRGVRVDAQAGYLLARDRAQDDFGDSDAAGQRLQLDMLASKRFASCLGAGPCTLGAEVDGRRERYTRGAVGPLITRSMGAVALARLAPWPAVALDVSLRRDWNREFGDADAWRAGVAARLGGPWRLYAAAGTGVVNPTATERFGFFPSSFVGNPGLIPERTRDREVGLTFDRGRLHGRASLFRQRLTDEIETVFDAGAQLFTARNAAGVSRRRGAELEARVPLGDAWSVRAHYTYTHATEPGAGGAQREIRRPRHQYGVALAYRQGRQRVTLRADAARAQVDLDFATVPAARVVLGNYTVAHLTWRWELSRNVAAVLDARNLFNETYQEVLGYRAPGRQVGLGLQWRLD